MAFSKIIQEQSHESLIHEEQGLRNTGFINVGLKTSGWLADIVYDVSSVSPGL